MSPLKGLARIILRSEIRALEQRAVDFESLFERWRAYALSLEKGTARCPSIHHPGPFQVTCKLPLGHAGSHQGEDAIGPVVWPPV